MNRPLQPADESARIEQQAAHWILRRDRGLSAAEQDEFSQWLAADRRHGAAFGQHGWHWDRLDQLAEWRPSHSLRPNPDLLATGSRAPHWLLPLALAAAAAVALAVFVRWPRPAPAWDSPLPSAPVAMIEERTLEDGSRIELNRGGEITVNFTAEERLVHLVRGEAHFRVAKNAAWPFIVDAGGVRVRAVGTAFDVRFGNAAVAVLVTEGKVRVDGPSGTTPSEGRGRDLPARAPAVPLLEAGQTAVVSMALAGPSPRVTTLSPAAIQDRLAWRPRLLDFTAAPLAAIAAEFNRHNLVQLTVAEPDLAELRISASFRSDNIAGFVSLLEASFKVRAERRGVDEIVLRKAL